MIPIKNVYHMLAYAFKLLVQDSYKNIDKEKFENVADLCAAILITGIKTQIKRGLMRDYIPETETLSSLRGKIDISESIKSQSMIKRQMVCSYDDYSIDCKANQILKSTVNILIKSDISADRKKELRKLLPYFANVSIIDVHNINWSFSYNKNNENYRLLLTICQLVIKDLLQTQQDGSTKMMTFFDEQKMSRLYEKFILEYFKKHFPEVHASSPHINWGLDTNENMFLPQMKSDITLTTDDGNKTLIIDAKYYSNTMQNYQNTTTIHSANLYQIFTYVKNKALEAPNVSGMLLYAKTDVVGDFDKIYHMSGNKISVKTLDLNCDFDGIKSQLNTIAESFLEKVPS